jgi:hypothetical protein
MLPLLSLETSRINTPSPILLNRPALYYTPECMFTARDTVSHKTLHSQPKHFYSAEGYDFSDGQSQLRPDFSTNILSAKKLNFLCTYLINHHVMKIWLQRRSGQYEAQTGLVAAGNWTPIVWIVALSEDAEKRFNSHRFELFIQNHINPLYISWAVVCSVKTKL